MFCILARLLPACAAEDPPLLAGAPPEDPVLLLECPFVVPPFEVIGPTVPLPPLVPPLVPVMSMDAPPPEWWCEWCCWCMCSGWWLGCQGDIRWLVGGTAVELETTDGGEKHVEEELR